MEGWPKSRRTGALIFMGALVLVIITFECAPRVQKLPPRDNTNPYDVITTYCPPEGGGGAGKWGKFHFEPTLIRQFSFRLFHPPLPDPAPEKIYPLLRVWQKDSSLATRVRLLVTYRETLKMSRFPALDETLPRSDPGNQARLNEIRVKIGQFQTARDSSYKADSTDLVNNFSGEVLHRHWLTHSLLIEMPLSNIDSLAKRSNVVYIQPEVGAEAPPSCSITTPNPDNGNGWDDPILARKDMQLDSFRNLALAYGYVSLLDTGVWKGHKIFNGVTFGVAGDCIHGGLDCQQTTNTGFNTNDQCVISGHGTASAAILVGSTSLGAAWQGALDVTLDYFQVFEPNNPSNQCAGNCGLCLNADAAEHAFEKSLSNGDRVIVANLVSRSPDRAAVGMSAINAFDLGATVVAAIGNAGTYDEVTNPNGGPQSPGSAPCVIGVGARDIRDQGHTDVGQSVGPASGGRIKPDIQALSGIETAKIMDPDCNRIDLVTNLPGTSGATPYAGAAAALLRNWLKAGSNDVAPGNIYAAMILSGRHHGLNLNMTEGAGIIELPTDGCAWWSLALVYAGNVWNVPLDLSNVTADSLEAAIWWPEYPAVNGDGVGVTQHNNVDLHLIDPDGVERASSKQLGSVFERATAWINKKGRWTLSIECVSTFNSSVLQPVYWIAAARPKH